MKKRILTIALITAAVVGNAQSLNKSRLSEVGTNGEQRTEESKKFITEPNGAFAMFNVKKWLDGYIFSLKYKTISKTDLLIGEQDNLVLTLENGKSLELKPAEFFVGKVVLDWQVNLQEIEPYYLLTEEDIHLLTMNKVVKATINFQEMQFEHDIKAKHSPELCRALKYLQAQDSGIVKTVVE